MIHWLYLLRITLRRKAINLLNFERFRHMVTSAAVPKPDFAPQYVLMVHLNAEQYIKRYSY